MARRHDRGEARRQTSSGPEGPRFGIERTLTPDEASAAHEPTVLEAPGGAATPGERLAFPDLGGDDAQRMEDIVAARLFPRRATPQKIGRYTILDRLGQGGMGVVYAAYDPELDRRVAIKLLTETLAGQAEARLLREAQAMARVVHANVVSVIEVGIHQGRAFVVMEYVRGIGLDRWPQRAPHWRDTLRVYVQAGRGLAAAHRAGVIHRDFKPHNAMLVEGGVDDGRVKVLDFGLARATLQDPEQPALVGEAPTGALAQPLTRTGAVMGTPAYMAPEQLSGQPASERSDQYSFAASLYEALYGQLPFAGETLSALMLAVSTGELRPPPTGSPVPAWVHRVVVRGLARAPGDRFASISAMCDALEHDPSARRRTVALALALGAAVGGGGWGLARLGAEAPPSPCTGPGFALTDVWNDERAAAVDAAFAATDLSYATDTTHRVRPLLDAYADGWTTMRRDACEVHQRGEQSAQLLDLRMTCLDHRRAGFAALAGQFAAADATVVERAVEATLSLPPLAACADVAALTAETPPPADPSAARAVERARTRMAEIGAQLGAGRLVAAAAAAEDVLDQAEGIGFAPAIAEAALTLGKIRIEQGNGSDAERSLTIAARQGIIGRADRLVAEAIARRFFVRGVLLARPGAAESDEELVDAYSARFPADGALRWLSSMNRGAVAFQQGDLASARAMYERALGIEHGPTPLDLARTRANLGLFAFESDDFGTALAEYRRAIEQAAAAIGEFHPFVTQLRMFEGSALLELGRYREARHQLERVAQQFGPETEQTTPGLWTRIYLSRLDTRLGHHAEAREQAARTLSLASDTFAVINAELALADALIDAPEEALARYASALERCTAAFGADSTLVLGALRWIGQGMLRLGRPHEALPIARRRLELARKLDGEDAVSTARGRRLLADVLLALNDVAPALVEARAALTALAARPGERPVDRTLAHHTLGRALLANGAAAEALEVLKAGLEFADKLDADAPEAVALRDELALALAGIGPL